MATSKATHPHPDKQHVVDCCRRYILACGRKFTGRQHGTARSLIHYRGILETYVASKRHVDAAKQEAGRK